MSSLSSSPFFATSASHSSSSARTSSASTEASNLSHSNHHHHHHQHQSSDMNGGIAKSPSARRMTDSIVVDSASLSGLSLQSLTPQTPLVQKHHLLNELTRTIKMVQKCFLEKEGSEQEALTNSDDAVHELCEHFDYVFLLGLKRPEEGYWKLVVEFTHHDIIDQLKRLFNVTTNHGRGRAWIYHALNENLMECYLRCFQDDRRLVSRFYSAKNKATLVTDHEALDVLITLVSGLENVQFKLHNDVPYLDYSCWPTHLKIKRINSTVMESFQSKNSSSNNLNSRKPKPRNVNNFSLDYSETSSTNNLSDMSIDHVPIIMDPFIPSRKSKERRIKKSSKSAVKRIQTDESHSGSENDTGNKSESMCSSYADNSRQNVLSFLDRPDYKTSLSTDTTTGHRERRSQSTLTTSTEIDKEIERLKQTSKMTSDAHTTSHSKHPQNEQQTAIGASKLHSFSLSSASSMNQELVASSLDTSLRFDKKIANLEAFSRKIEDSTEKMGSCLEDMNSVYNNMSTNIEFANDATPGDENRSLFDMSEKNKANEEKSVYDCEHDEIEEPTPRINPIQTQIPQESETIAAETTTTTTDTVIRRQSTLDEPRESNQTNGSSGILGQTSFESSSQWSLSKNQPVNEETISTVSGSNSYQVGDDRQSIGSSISSSKINSRSSVVAESMGNENDYLDDSNRSYEEDFRQELKVDNNTKLIFSIEIFQNGPNEEFVKLFQVTRGHSQGEIEAVFLMITTHGVYVMTRLAADSTSNNGSNDSNRRQEANKNRTRFKKESFISHTNIEYIEVSLGEQAFHIVCMSKRQNIWITTASRTLTSDIVEGLQLGRLQNKQLKFAKISVFYEATQQKLALKKFISKEENLTSQDIEIKNYSLVFWEDQDSQEDHLIHKEGPLYFYHKSSGASSSPTEWKKGYFVLKNDVLTKYKTANDKRPTNVIKLNGEDFSGCRRNQTSSRAHTIELVLSNSNVLYLSAKSDLEASEWLQSFCKVISLGNLHTDVPVNSCLPCCAVTTTNRLYFCHEDLITGFYRLLETIKLQEINRISFDNDNPFYCILHDDLDEKNEKKNRYWYIYFTDKKERNSFITSFKESWEILFQIPFTVEKCKNDEMRKRCIKGIRAIHKTWENIDDFD